VQLKAKVRALKEQAASADAAKQAEVGKEIDELETKITATHKRVLGNMSFIGELFRKKMITNRIINTCIVELVGERALDDPEGYFSGPQSEDNVLSNEDVECLTKLLKTVGWELDQGDYKAVVGKYFKYLAVLERQSFLDVRHKFMVQDLAELRNNDWQERRATLKVKTKDEVKADYDNEEIEAQRRSMAAARNSRGNAPPPSSSGSRGGSMGGRGTGRGVMGTLTQDSKPSGGFGRGPVAQDANKTKPVPTVRAIAKPAPVSGAAAASSASAASAASAAGVAPLLVPSTAPNAQGGAAAGLTREQAKQKFNAAIDEWMSEHNLDRCVSPRVTSAEGGLTCWAPTACWRRCAPSRPSCRARRPSLRRWSSTASLIAKRRSAWSCYRCCHKSSRRCPRQPWCKPARRSPPRSPT